MDQDFIYGKLKEHLDRVNGEGYKCIFLGLVGSQNYGLDYEHSDVDSKCIVVPTLQDIASGKEPVSTTLIMDDNSHVDVKDVRMMFNCFKKQNPNYVELLFTPWSFSIQGFEDLIGYLKYLGEKVARFNMGAAVNAMYGMTREKYKALEHPYPTIVDKIEKFGYDPKQIHHMARMVDMMERYISGERYSDILIPRNPDILMDIKFGKLTLEEARALAQECLEATDKMRSAFAETDESKYIDEPLRTYLDGLQYDIIRRSLLEELGV